jgi:hypothetical protein
VSVVPIVNVIQGERLPDSMLNVRTPIVRIPMWAAITWWTTKGLAGLVRWYLRHWYATLPATALVWAYLRFGWLDLVIAAGMRHHRGRGVVVAVPPVVPPAGRISGRGTLAADGLPPVVACGDGHRRPRRVVERSTHPPRTQDREMPGVGGCGHSADGVRADPRRLRQSLPPPRPHVQSSRVSCQPRPSGRSGGVDAAPPRPPHDHRPHRHTDEVAGSARPAGRRDRRRHPPHGAPVRHPNPGRGGDRRR